MYKDRDLAIFLVAHTHWDREWYAPFEVFRARLADLLDGLLPRLESEPEHPDFVLDGQSVALEDYLELRPEEGARVRRLVQEGRLRVGPFHVLPDEFLVSGEALVRNLELGIRTALSFGACEPLGYVPDSFGHVSQLPQILRGFGMEAFLFTRGLGEGPVATAYRWRGPDGSALLALQQVRSYSHVGRLPTDPEEAADRLEAAVDELRPFLSVPVVLLCHGGDHHFPAPRLPEIVARLRGRGRYAVVRTGGFIDYARAAATAAGELPDLQGELRGGRLFPLLAGMLSARGDLKRANHSCQLLLERRVEPADAMAALLGGSHGGLRRALLDRAWRLLLLNHPHDSIGGCSVDAVHLENRARFQRVEQLGEEVRSRALEAQVRRLHASPDFVAVRALRIGNPSPFRRQEVVEVTLDLQPGELLGRPGIRDSEGRALPCQVMERRAVEGSHPFPSAWPVDRLRLAFLPPPVEGLGWDVVYLVQDAGPSPETARPGPSLWLDPEDEGSLILLSGDMLLGGVHRLHAVRDEGDTYNASPRGAPLPVIVESAQVLQNGPLVWSLALSGSLGEHAWWRTEALLRSGCGRVDFRTRIELELPGLRVRALFPPPGPVERHFGHTPFDVVHRPLAPEDPGLWKFETPPDGHPAQWCCGLEGADHRLALFPRGLCEYGVEPGLSVGLTLLRSVSWLSRQGLPTRTVEAGPKLRVADAEGRGRHDLEYGLLVPAPMDDVELLREAERFQLPLEVEEVPQRVGDLPSRGGLLALEGPAVLSALRRVGEEVEVRVFNPGGAPGEVHLRWGVPMGKGRRVELDGRERGTGPSCLGPGEIATWRFPAPSR